MWIGETKAESTVEFPPSPKDQAYVSGAVPPAAFAVKVTGIDSMADLVCIDLFARLKNYGEMKRGPRPMEASLDNGVVKVSFSGVNGRLQSDGRISGFSIHDSKGALLPMIYKTRVDPAEASTVLLYVQGRLPADAVLWYGFGKDPYCNVRDAADMAVPVFAIKIASSAASGGTRAARRRESVLVGRACELIRPGAGRLRLGIDRRRGRLRRRSGIGGSRWRCFDVADRVLARRGEVPRR